VARHIDQSLAIGERPLAGRPKRYAGMGTHGFQQHGDCLSNRAVVSANMKSPQKLQGVSHLDGTRVESIPLNRPHRIEMTRLAIDALPKSQERFIAKRNERPPQCSEYLELVVRPFNGRQAIAKRYDLLALMERAPAHEDMRDASGFQRTDIGPGDVSAVVAEPAEKDRDVP
jgi:hypothetical protein